MATIYVDDLAAGADDGTSWADSFTSLTSVTPTAAGDIIYIAATHDEDLSGYITLDGGTFASPVWLISATAGSDPPAYAAGATFRDSNTSKGIRPGTNDYVSYWGLTILGIAGNYDDIKLGDGSDAGTYYFNCTFEASDRIYLITGTDHYSKHTSCSYTMTGTRSTSELYQTGLRAVVDIRDGDVSNTLRSHAVHLEHGCGTTLRACDLSDFEIGVRNTSTSNGAVAARISGCEVGSSFVPATTAHTSKPSNFAQMDYCATGALGATDAVNGFTGSVDYAGETTLDTARYRSGGAKDSITGDSYSHAISGRYGTLSDGHNSCELVSRVAGGGEITVTLYLAGGSTLYNDQFWFDLFGPATTSTPRQHFHTTRLANPTATKAELTSDSSTWTGSGVGTRYKVSYSYTPHHPGLIHAVPVFAKAGGTVYVDPILKVS